MRYKTVIPTNYLDWPRVQNLLPELKLIALFLWGYKDLGCCGAGFVALGGFASSVSLKPEAVASAFQTLETADLVIWDPESSEIFVSDWYRVHSFKSTLSLQMLKNSTEKIQSDKIKNAVSDKSKHLFVSPNAAMPKPKSAAKNSGNEDDVVDVFITNAGNSAALISNRDILKKEIFGASHDQARLAGLAWQETKLKGAVKSEIGLAITLCGKAVKGEVTPGDLAEGQAKVKIKEERERAWKRLSILSGNKYQTEDGFEALIDGNVIQIQGKGMVVGADALKCLIKIEEELWERVID